MGQFNTSRLRRAFKTIAWAAGGADFIAITGPADELVISWFGTADNHTIDIVGMARAVANLTITSSKRGQVCNISGISLHALFESLWGEGYYYTDTVGGSAADGMSGVMPIGCDADESLNLAFTFGTLAQIASTGDLAGYAANVRVSARVINRPVAGTYWAFRDALLNGTGVLGIAAQGTQPLAPVIPGFYLTGETFTCLTANLQTAMSPITLAQVHIYQGEDPIVDDFTIQLIAEHWRTLNNGRAGFMNVLGVRHAPVPNNSATVVAATNGGVATIFPSQVLYIYIVGQISERVAEPQHTAPPSNSSTPQLQGQTAPTDTMKTVMNSMRRT